MHEGIFDELELFHSLKARPNNYEKYIEHFEQVLIQETPLAYGLHSNAEIGFRTQQFLTLFSTLLELQPKDNTGDESVSGMRTKDEIVQELIKQLAEDINLISMIFNIDAENKEPYQNVFLQELEYMNYLLIEIVRSIDEIDHGFRGILKISQQMEQIIDAIALNRVQTV